VNKETLSIAVLHSAGKRVVESILETKPAMILQFIQGLRGKMPGSGEPDSALQSMEARIGTKRIKERQQV
jgi:hypothetical protein